MVPTKYLSFLQISELGIFCQIFAIKLVTLHGNRIEGLDYVQSVNILVLWLNVHSVEIPIIYSHVPNLLKISSNWLELSTALFSRNIFQLRVNFSFSTLWCSKTRNTWKKSREIIFDSWFHEIFQLNRQNMTFT